MDAMKIIEKLAEAARKEQMPQIDVCKAVMAEIDGLGQEPTYNILSFEWFAGISAAAASIVTLLSIPAWRYIVNPLVQLLTPLQEAALW
ncbi:MAG: hypothetical protein A2173_09295 [Planctomycetes bacterium RBG_13_44_8b]|nr:MAG: hypothetical protein A2173_09295 [Planctomycetes bacterium RBG_13_44_8b]